MDRRERCLKNSSRAKFTHKNSRYRLALVLFLLRAISVSIIQIKNGLKTGRGEAAFFDNPVKCGGLKYSATSRILAPTEV